MSAEFFADYMKGVKVLFDEVDTSPDNFRTFNLHIELAHKGMFFVYETKRRQGQSDSIYYARSASSGINKQISQKTAYDAVNAFMSLAEFVALSGDLQTIDALSIESEHPCCAIAFDYRKTGMPKTASMKMIFLGFADAAHAQQHAADIANATTLIGARPFRTERIWEWK